MSDHKPAIYNHLISWIASLLFFALAFGAVAWRTDQAPDLFTDEIIYTRLGVRVNGEAALVWDSGEPFVVHPPLYYLVEGLYLGLVGTHHTPLYATGDIFTTVQRARLLNAILAGLTAVVIYQLGKRLRSPWLGLFMTTLFVLDPFGVRINRRAMLETLAVLLSLSGMALLLAKHEGESKAIGLRRAIAAGLLLGLALLTKELAVINLLAVLVIGLWEVVRVIRGAKTYQIIKQPLSLSGAGAPFLATGIAVLTYAIYPLWMFVGGQWSALLAEKTLGVWRVLGLVQLTGWNRPGVSLLDFLLQRLVDYGSSYLLLALGGVGVVWLLAMGRNRGAGRYLGAWGLVLYPFFAFTALFGSGNDQFFYFLLVPGIVIVGYAVFDYGSWIARRRAERPAPPAHKIGLRALRVVILQPWLPAALLLLLVLPYNLFMWTVKFGLGVDNAYRQLVSFVEHNLPPGELLNASGDPIKMHYFLPEWPVAAAATPAEAQAVGIHYFALAPKDVQAQYGEITPELAAWIMLEGEIIFTAKGDSYGEVSLYRVDYPGEPTVSPGSVPGLVTLQPGDIKHWRSFGPAQGGFIGGFWAGLGLWAGVCALAAFALVRPRQGFAHPSVHPLEWQAPLEAQADLVSITRSSPRINTGLDSGHEHP